MPRHRPIVTQLDATIVLAEDFARAAREMGDMSNYYRWRDVAKQWRAVDSHVGSFGGVAGGVSYRVDYVSGPPPFDLKHSGVLLPLP